jgi:hypothetical protein
MLLPGLAVTHDVRRTVGWRSVVDRRDDRRLRDEEGAMAQPSLSAAIL